jgi:hypothetical protein
MYTTLKTGSALQRLISADRCTAVCPGNRVRPDNPSNVGAESGAGAAAAGRFRSGLTKPLSPSSVTGQGRRGDGSP